MGMIEGVKQLADAWGYSVSHTKKILAWAYKHLPDSFKSLEHWVGPKHRLKLTPEESLRLKSEIRKRKIEKKIPDDTKRYQMSLNDTLK